MNKQIFIVEDDPGIMEALTLILSEEGYDIFSTTDGNKAVSKIKKSCPKLVFLDLLMSGTDGREICSKLKKDTKTKDISVVMVSAHPNAKHSALECGADDFLAKPFEVEELLSVAKKYTK